MKIMKNKRSHSIFFFNIYMFASKICFSLMINSFMLSPKNSTPFPQFRREAEPLQ